MDGYVPGAHLIPRGFLELDVEEDVTLDREEPIVLYCAGGNRSALAARDLEAMGYTRVSSMIGGIKAWKEAGFGIEQDGLLSDEDLQRYSRHITLPEVGEKGQQDLLKAKVLLIGAGGLGCPSALYLAAAGVGTLGLVDADVVDRSNLQRQVLFGEDVLGQPKVEAARDRLLKLNPGIHVEAHHELMTSANAMEIIDGLRHRRERLRQLPDALPGQRRRGPLRQAGRRRQHLPLRGAGHGLPPRRRRTLLPLPVSRAAPSRRGAQLRRGGGCSGSCPGPSPSCRRRRSSSW